MADSPTKPDPRTFLHRLAVLTGVIGVLLVVAGTGLAIRVGQAPPAIEPGSSGGGGGSSGGAGSAGSLDAMSVFMVAIALPGALLLLMTGPMWRASRWACWLAQFTTGYLIAVFAVQSWRAGQQAGWQANAELTVWLTLTATMAALIVYLVRGGWAAQQISRVRRRRRPGTP